MREYQPKTGQFAAQDIILGIQNILFTMNRYTYCYNNPVLLVDRNGMFPSMDKGERISKWIAFIFKRVPQLKYTENCGRIEETGKADIDFKLFIPV